MFQNQNYNKNYKLEKGASIVEILVAIFIISLIFTALFGVATFSLQNSVLIKETAQANNIAQETMEAVRNFRDGIAWNNNDPENKYDGLGVINTGVAYYPTKSTDLPAKWQLVQGTETIGVFTRKVVFENVMRDGSDNIVASGGTNDPNTKKVTVTVSWRDKKVEIFTYLTNWK